MKFSILWRDPVAQGSIYAEHAEIVSGRLAAGAGHYEVGSHTFHTVGSSRLDVEVHHEQLGPGAYSALIAVRTGQQAFSFFLRDVSEKYPIYIREYGVIVTLAEHEGSYEELADAIERQGLLTALQQIESEPEESYAAAAAATRPLTCPVWLGLSRDVRLFEAHYRGSGDSDMERAWDCVRPRLGGEGVPLPEMNDKPALYYYLLGRGLGCEHRMTRRLEQGVYPIVHAVIEDGDIKYNNTAFVSYEFTALTAATLRGTSYLKADQYGVGYMFTPQQREAYEQLKAFEAPDDEETVYYSRTVAVNPGRVPRYAWFKNPVPSTLNHTYQGGTGFGLLAPDRVYVVSKLDGQPMPQEEIAVLLQPGESVVYEFYIPHRPIAATRAERLRSQSFEQRFGECLRFWHSRLQRTMQIELPEPRIQEMMQAGYMHLELVSYGLEPDQTLVPAIGVYTAIGSESSPIIQYLDSIGAHSQAERSLQFFLDKQHDSGFIQNFGGYMLETGAALWSMGEHYRYVRDEQWVSRIKPKLLKAYEYIMQWRGRNFRDELRGRGYGMLEGKTADPEDHFRSFMLNGFAYIGLMRLAEMLAAGDKPMAGKIRQEADAFKQDIRESLQEALARSPVIPLGDGSWVPSCPPWAEYRGPLSLYAEGGTWGTHGSIVARDSLLGPLYLVLQEVLEPNEPETGFLLQMHSELMCMRNVALSQPYYSIHPWIHLKRGEVKPFLKAFYNGLAGLADRELYTFWEHYWHASPHKTHEEGWFLMLCRWMLYMEEKAALRLLAGIPRSWLEQDRRLAIRRAASYFGSFSMEVESDIGHGSITARIDFHSDRIPETVCIRLPHPLGKPAIGVSRGVYRADNETVIIDKPAAQEHIVLQF